jgi:hypothetical protein
MSHKMTVAMYGSLAELDDLLEDTVLDESEIRAALQNVIRQLQHLQKQVERAGEKYTGV